MKWDEFRDLLVGIGPETPLGRIVAIRSEDDKEILKHFTKAQRRIRSEWRSKRAVKVDPAQTAQVLEALKKTFISLAAGGDRQSQSG